MANASEIFFLFICPEVKFPRFLSVVRSHSSLSVFLFHFIHELYPAYLFILKTLSISLHRCLFWGSSQSSAWFFRIVTQDLCFKLCCQTNKIVHLAHCKIIISPQRDAELVLVRVVDSGHWFVCQTANMLKHYCTNSMTNTTEAGLRKFPLILLCKHRSRMLKNYLWEMLTRPIKNPLRSCLSCSHL